MEATSHVCRRCKLLKPLAELSPKPAAYKTYACRKCVNEDARRNHHNDPFRKPKARASNLRRRYGMSLADYQQRLLEQYGSCAICTRSATACFNGLLHVDHDHETGAVRGLLCPLCNTVLGKMNDDPALLRKAATYLEDT
jgi:hypothetical protein